MSKLVAGSNPPSLKRLRHKIGSWDNLTALEAAVRLESFTQAAHELGVSQPAISRRIHDLESGLGIALFVRNGKRLAVTPTGQELQAILARAFADIDQELERALRYKQPEGVTLRITPSASGWILPALGGLCNAFPDIPVNLVCLDVRADPRQTEYDLQLCFMAAGPDSPYRHLMLPGEVLQVASPAFMPLGDIDPLQVPLLQMDNPFARELDWRHWYPADADRLDIRSYSSYAGALEGAVAGRGIALGWRYSVGPHVHAGRLIRIGDELRPSEFGEFLFVSPARSEDASVKKICGWLSAYAVQLQGRYEAL